MSPSGNCIPGEKMVLKFLLSYLVQRKQRLKTCISSHTKRFQFTHIPPKKYEKLAVVFVVNNISKHKNVLSTLFVSFLRLFFRWRVNEKPVDPRFE